MIYLVSQLHPDFMCGPATKAGGYTDKNLSLWKTILDKTLSMGVKIMDIPEIYEAVREQKA
jgi:hypothetical protein